MASLSRPAAFIASTFSRFPSASPASISRTLRRPRFISPFLSRTSKTNLSTRKMTFLQTATPVASAAPAATSTAIAEPKEKFLKDYTPPTYLISDTRLIFELDIDGLDTIVRSKLAFHRAPSASKEDLVLDGKELRILDDSLQINGNALSTADYVYDTVAHTLTISASAIPDAPFVFESAVQIKPAKNTALDGLYMSAGDYSTQCEAEAFRKITFYPDRPDVMAKFSVRVEADSTRCPVLLSNGNCVDKGISEADPTRHWAEYVDPFPKPCYLFALVAGDLAHLEDKFTTMGGNDVTLRVYVKGQEEVAKCHHAMRSLQRAMLWDEETYGLEYNYDIFNIVAVPSFVFGAMENTSLNIFNSKYVLVSPETATDTDFNNVEGVVAHEYFHNYSGNRVTVSSWFQLSLKEGLTVFRDQSFSADMNSATVKRIRDVSILRNSQFAEDAGPMAHPIRPASYITCNSFYTATVYNKGAEVIRMLKTVVGPEGFRRGTDIYFSRNDGKAVTCEDWVQAIQDANPQVDLTVFKKWYAQSGTPILTVDVNYDDAKSAMSLTCEQAIPSTQKQPNPEPAMIPIRMGLIGPDGSPVPVDVGDGSKPELTKVLNLVDAKTEYMLHNVPKGTVPSLLRDFSAPVKLVRKGGVTPDELAFIMGNDTDEFTKWDAGQELALGFILECVKSEDGLFQDVPETVIEAFRKTLLNEKVDAALRAEVFKLPSESYIVEQMDIANPVRIRAARKHVMKQLAEKLEGDLKKIVDIGLADTGEYKLDTVSQGNRALKNVALSYLARLGKKETYELCLKITREGSNMTDVLAALVTLASTKSEERVSALKEFYAKWQSYGLVVDKWLMIQSTSSNDDVLDVVKELTAHAAYKETVPNSIYALIGGYGQTNLHMPTDGSGYKFMGDQVIHLNSFNPQVAARMARTFTRWRKYDKTRQAQMEVELKRIKSTEGLSKDVFEIVNNCLSQAE